MRGAWVRGLGLRGLLPVLFLALLAPSATGDEAQTGDIWDWRVAKDPAYTLNAALYAQNHGGGVVLQLEPTQLACTFWRGMATDPLPERLPPIVIAREASAQRSARIQARSVLAQELKALATSGVSDTPLLESVRDNIRFAAENLPAPRTVFVVTTRAVKDRSELEVAIIEAQRAECKVVVVAPEVAFSDNGTLLLESKVRSGEAPVEEVPFEWDINLPALWLAQVRWTGRQAELVPEDVRRDPWHGHSHVRTRGFNYVPSGFGDYALSRLAAETKGRFYLNRFGAPSKTKARCTFLTDPGKFRRLAPSLAHKQTYWNWRRKDENAVPYDRAISILLEAPGLLARDPRRKNPRGIAKNLDPLPLIFRSKAELANALKLAKRKDQLAVRALKVLDRFVLAYRSEGGNERFLAHGTLLKAWLHRVRFHLSEYQTVVGSIKDEKRLASGVAVQLAPRVLWEFCFGVRGAGQRNLGYRGGETSQRLLSAVVDSSMIVRRRYGNTPWETASKLGFLITYVEGWADGRTRGPAPAPKSAGSKKKPTTPSRKGPKQPSNPPPPTPVTTPSRPSVGGSGTGGAVTGG